MMRACLSLSFVALAIGAGPTPPERSRGVVPVDAAGKPLNLDFETGTLKDWKAEGDAFAGQPVEGDAVNVRRPDMASRHAGKFWVGSYEIKGDPARGTLTSAPFRVTHPFASFLIGAGSHPTTRAEVVARATGKVLFTASGADVEDMHPAVVDLRGHKGEEIFVRLVDDDEGGWGHVNFDDFRFHDEAPAVPTKPAADVVEHDGLSPEAAARAMTLPPGFSADRLRLRRQGAPLGRRGVLVSQPRPRGQGARPNPDLRGRRRRRSFRLAQGLRRQAEPRQRPGGRLRRRLRRRGPEPAVHPRQGPRRHARRPAGRPARRLGLPGHARDPELVRLGSRRLALRLSRRLHPLARRQARHPGRRPHADQRRHLAVSPHEAHLRGLRPRDE